MILNRDRDCTTELYQLTGLRPQFEADSLLSSEDALNTLQLQFEITENMIMDDINIGSDCQSNWSLMERESNVESNFINHGQLLSSGLSDVLCTQLCDLGHFVLSICYRQEENLR